ncbi:unnamed protein product [Cladocopium goreaui]|uniref:Uncharacterized protein n=1 Tax=Cladocopium goreaui TaxID=2562237 RepID=A0A9P1C3M3_9DINO|nr:unnamed protein product [Cladocopium goreaui]
MRWEARFGSRWRGGFFCLLGLACLLRRNVMPAFAETAEGAAVAARATLRQATLGAGQERPAENAVLRALLDLQKEKTQLNKADPYLGKLTGSGRSGGKRWRLVYLATRNAVVAERKGQAPPSFFDRGWYVDGLVTAVQRFEDSPAAHVNQNGVFEFLGLGGFFFGYFARFKWPSPEKRTTLAFQPITNNLKLFGQDWSWPFAASGAAGAGPEGDAQFEASRLQDLNIFNFFYVDDQVAVAQGASGSVALWGATDPEWDQKHLIPVEGEA